MFQFAIRLSTIQLENKYTSSNKIKLSYTWAVSPCITSISSHKGAVRYKLYHMRPSRTCGWQSPSKIPLNNNWCSLLTTSNHSWWWLPTTSTIVGVDVQLRRLHTLPLDTWTAILDALWILLRHDLNSAYLFFVTFGTLQVVRRIPYLQIVLAPCS